ncbi:MAG: VWA domain-containing protein [Planctomycetota bacterium]
MGLTDPLWLAVVLLLVPLAAVVLGRRSPIRGARRAVALVCRFLLLAAIALVLADASTVRETNRLAVVVVIDASESVDRFAGPVEVEPGSREPFRSALESFLRIADENRGPDDLLGVVTFGGRAVAVATPTTGSIEGRSFERPLPDGTDIGRALDLAAALVPSDAAGRIVLISDGNATSGDALGAALRLAGGAGSGSGDGVRIDTAAVPYSVAGETVVESVTVPGRAAPGTRVPVRIEIASTQGGNGRLRLFQNGVEIDISPDNDGAPLPVSLSPGRQVVLAEALLGSRRMNRFVVEYEPDASGSVASAFTGDAQLDNNAAEAFTLTSGAGSIVIVDQYENGEPTPAAANLARAMQTASDRIEVVSPESLPTDLLSMQDYDLVVLNNVPADAVAAESQAALAAHVTRVGCGLIMVGGRSSFGAGGWAGTPIEPLLPLHLDLSERLVERRTALVFVLDRSGSMGSTVGGTFRSQQAIANEAAAGAAATLGPTDLVGVVAFSNEADWVVPLAENENVEQTAEAIRGISSNGGTNVLPALQLAAEALRPVEAAVKHVIVLSDGRSRSADALPEFAQTMADEGINVSTISVGDNADTETMFLVAETGGGIHYAVTNPSVLPRVFVRAVRTIRDPLIKEGDFETVSLGSAGVSGVTAPYSGWPGLRGLVLTRFREDPTALAPLATDEGDPVLAHWNAELGRVGAYTADAAAWAPAWVGWADFARFWSGFARQMSRPPGNPNLELDTSIADGRFEIRVAAVDAEGQSINGLSAEATVFSPSGESRRVRLDQVGPGAYEAAVPARETGSYVAIVRAGDGDAALAPVIGGATRGDSVEYRRLTPDERLLEAVAEAGGGERVSLDRETAASLFDRRDIEPKRAETPLRPWLLAVTLLLAVLDIAARRISWDRFFERAPRDAQGVEQPVSVATRIRKRERAVDPSVALSETDADRVAMEARQRRRRQRVDNAQPQRADTTPSATDPPARPPVIVPDEPYEPNDPEKDDPDDGASGLLAAKRRARDRYRGD